MQPILEYLLGVRSWEYSEQDGQTPALIEHSSCGVRMGEKEGIENKQGK